MFIVGKTTVKVMILLLVINHVMQMAIKWHFRLKLELAYLSNNTVKTHYSTYKAENYGISKTQWDNLIKKCQWFRS